MSDNKKNLKLKLSLEKETLRVLDDSQLHLLGAAVGGLMESGFCELSCVSSQCATSCQGCSCGSVIEVSA